MDFSSDVLIDTGLNIAGYIVAALIIYLLTGWNKRRASAPGSATVAPAAAATGRSVPAPAISPAHVARAPEFISLSGIRPEHDEGKAGAGIEVAGAPGATSLSSRRDHRRAIYEEARRLLAAGKPRCDLLNQLPLTEGELEMLTVTGKA